jgi:hypothetical protein
MTLKKSFKRVKDFLVGLPRLLARRVIIFSSALFFLSFLLVYFAFQYYYVFVQKKEISLTEKPLQFQEEAVKKFLIHLDERKKRIGEEGARSYPDIFRPQGVEKTEEPEAEKLNRPAGPAP